METVRSRVWILGGFVAVLLLVLLDQWSKSAVFDFFQNGMPDLVRDVHGHQRHLVLGDWFSFMTSCNSGAAFGQFDQFPHALVVGRILAVLFLTYLLVRADTRYRAGVIAMTLVLAGAIGNVIDNLWTGCSAESAPYGVRDFVNVWFEPLIGWDYHFPSFNVADACISVGAVLWVVSGLFGHHGDDAASTSLAGGEPAPPSNGPL